jgi:glycine oxidase
MPLLWVMEIDFLLIGHGIAGGALGYRLKKEGQKILIVDQPEKNQSSRVAAGLYNPITGRKMVKSWISELLFPEIKPFYTELEEVTGRNFLREQAIYRPFLSIEEQNEWMGHSSDPEIQQFIENIFTESQFEEVKDPYGGVIVKHSGWLNINELLDGLTDYFQHELVNEYFDETLLFQEDGFWRYKAYRIKAIVFCNGVEAKKSSFFSFLPFAPVKGEILELVQNFNPECILNRGVFRVNLSSNICRVGSTYTWHDLDLGPSETAQNELMEKLLDLVKVPVEQVFSHKSGIRPATKDRKPFLGKHPVVQSVYIFNGFGAKGVSLVPYFSKMMSDYLLKKAHIMAAVDVTRYFKHL